MTYRFALKKVYKGEIVPRPLRIVLRGRRFTQGERTHHASRILFGTILTYRFALKKVYKGARAHAYYPYRFALKKVYKGEIVPRLLRIVLRGRKITTRITGRSALCRIDKKRGV